MGSSTNRWRAAALLACLLAAQMHFFVESRATEKTPHECQVCKTGTWAILAPAPSLKVLLNSAPLGDPATPALAHEQSADASAPRAPPQS